LRSSGEAALVNDELVHVKPLGMPTSNIWTFMDECGAVAANWVNSDADRRTLMNSAMQFIITLPIELYGTSAHGCPLEMTAPMTHRML
jgi:hypothetical protein